MKQLLRKTIPLLLALSLTLGLMTPASAAFSDLTDVKGHWAEKTLKQAYEDGILLGTEADKMSPNQSVTTIQAVTILCRVLQVTGAGDTTGFEIPEGIWYAPEVAKGVYAGLLTQEDAAGLNDPVARGKAVLLFAKAFQFVPAQPDLSLLAQFPDAKYLTGDLARAAAALISLGVLTGDNGQLSLERPLTRAEFSTILYRLADQYVSSGDFTGHDGAGCVLSGDAALTGLDAGTLWFDQTAANVSFTDVTAQNVTLRSDALASLTFAGTGSLGRLTLAAGSGDVALALPETYTLGTLAVADGTGSVTLNSPAATVEVTGDGRAVSVNSSLDTLVLAGDNNTVTVKNGCTVGQITVTGTGNTLSVNGKTDLVLLAGRDNTVKGSGRAKEVQLNTRYYKLTLSKNKLTKWTGYDIQNVAVTLDAPADLPAGEVLKATAHITAPEEDLGKLCTAAWYLNGALMSETPFILGEEDPVSAITPEYNHDLKRNGTVKFLLTYVNNDGDPFTQEAAANVQLENYEDLGLADAKVYVTLPETLAAGETLTATASIATPEVGQVCEGTWFVDGKEVASAPLVLGGEPATFTHKYDYYYGMPAASTVSYRLTYTTKDGRDQQVSGSAQVALENFPDNGIAKATLSLSAPSPLPAGKTLEVTGQVNYLEGGKACTATWYVDGVKVLAQPVTLGTDVPKLTHNYKYTEDMKLSSEIKLVLSYTTADGRAQSISATKKITLQNYDYLYYHGISAEEVLAMVTDRYAGNYTLAWAQTHDYKPEIKTAWVNLKGYKSNTKYLVWVNLTYQRVNIFEGSQGKWHLVRSCLCGSGTNATPTIKGVFTTSYKQSAWNYGSYYCGPIVRFYGTSGYAFHSRLQYWPMNSDRYYDARIGFPISHGCLRMYNDDIWWMYNNIPQGTTVVVH